MRVAVVGAGPAGGLLSWHLARDGADVTVFDPSHPREKPCGGGLTARALDLLPPAPKGDPLRARLAAECRLESGSSGVDISLSRPVAVASRRDLDSWLLRQAVAAGAKHVAERVVLFSQGSLRLASGRELAFDCVVGADGAGSLVRRAVLAPIPRERLTIAAGWFAPGASSMVIRFAPEIAGYLWLFPRVDHVGVGICGPLGRVPTRALLGRLEEEVQRWFPALLTLDGERYAHTIPSPSTDPASILEIAGSGWALVGDAAGLADPLTGEGIYFALRSARLLADTLREGAPLSRYAERALEDFGRELLKAVSIRERFFEAAFLSRMLDFARRSAGVRSVLSDLVVGGQGYLTLRRRLVKALPRFVLDWLSSQLRAS